MVIKKMAAMLNNLVACQTNSHYAGTKHATRAGNGRVRRLLITFLLCAEEGLRDPLLYLSLYLKQHRSEYYDAAQRVRIDGDWEHWLMFFLTGVIEVAQQGVGTIQKLLNLFGHDAKRIRESLPGRRGLSALRVRDVLKERAMTTVALAARTTGLTVLTVTSALQELQRLGVVKEMTSRRRNRQFLYLDYYRTLDEGVA
jgi:Fic family protein